MTNANVILFEELAKVLAPIYYRGCLIMKEGACFKALGLLHPNLEAAKDAIDSSYVSLSNSINKI